MENQIKDTYFDDVEVEKRTFLKMKSNMEKDGYSEGIEEGRNKVFQKYFDAGYKDGFENGFLLGKLKGTIYADTILNQKDLIKIEEIEKSSTGVCIICKDDKNISLPIGMLKSNQKEVMNSSIVNIKGKTDILKVSCNILK